MVDIVSLPISLVKDIGNIGLWLQALGVVALITIIFEIITFILNRKRLKEISVIKKDIYRIEQKIDKIIGNRKK